MGNMQIKVIHHALLITNTYYVVLEGLPNWK